MVNIIDEVSLAVGGRESCPKEVFDTICLVTNTIVTKGYYDDAYTVACALVYLVNTGESLANIRGMTPREVLYVCNLA